MLMSINFVHRLFTGNLMRVILLMACMVNHDKGSRTCHVYEVPSLDNKTVDGPSVHNLGTCTVPTSQRKVMHILLSRWAETGCTHNISHHQ